MFFKFPSVVKEEVRLEELRKLFEAGKITTREYLDAVQGLKQVEDDGASALDVAQWGLIALVVGGAAYMVYTFK